MDRYRIESGYQLRLADRDAGEKAAHPDLNKKHAGAVLARLNAQLAELQKLLWSDGSRALLLVLQAMDTGGKDGTIRGVFTGVNPQGVTVHGFGVPGPHEIEHDYLWRVHDKTPARGRIAVFNRSHYEDVLIVRVNELVPREVWHRRYEHIRNFEQMLTDEGTVLVKIMLHISKDEQKLRLQARVDNPAKHFKFSMGDLEARSKWDQYQRAYEDAITETSTDDAPWYVVPSDRKWYRNLVISRILIDTLTAMNLSYPTPELDPTSIVIE